MLQRLSKAPSAAVLYQSAAAPAAETLSIAICYLLFAISSSAAPLSPEESLESFQTDPGLRVELAAAEPITGDPVAMAFDETGQLFVVENRGYPTGPGPGKPGEGAIARLIDTDHDGRYDKRIVFAEGLTFPNGLMPWRGGWIVTCAPDVFYLKDTDGDGRADVKKVLFTGFAVSGSTQLRTSHPTLGPDNWIYLTSGLTGGKVSSPDYPNHPAVELKTDFRFKPDTGEFEAAEGRSQFGMTFDDFGHRFICMNRMHAQHVVMPGRYLRRQPALNMGEPVQNIPESLEPEPVRGHGQAARVFPISKNITTADSHAGTFTSACGVMIYRGIGLPEEYSGNVFSCEPSGNLVHRDALIPKGATFIARRVRPGAEFLASSDNWFRPVYLTTGPDGALYICAMYRQVIDHPDYFPGELRKRLDFTAGKGMGRIYRVSKAGEQSKPVHTAFNTRSLVSLCRTLEHPNGWQRDTAHRLLLEKKDQNAAPELARILETSTKPEARVHALRLLEACQALTPLLLKRALQDPEPGVRENALQLIDSHDEEPVWLGEELLRLVRDPNPRVRFQAALALGDWTDSLAVAGLAQIAVLDAEDRWTRAAILSGIRKREEDFFAELITRVPANPSTAFAELMSELGRVLGQTLAAEKLAAMVPVVLQAEGSGWQLSCFNGLFEGARVQGKGAADKLREGLVAAKDNPTAKLVDAVFQNTNALPSQRAAALMFLGHLHQKEHLPLLEKSLQPAQPQEVRVAAIRALGQLANRGAATVLLGTATWSSFTPALREAALNTVLTQPSMLPVLLDALEKGQMPVTVLTAAQRKQLLAHKDPDIKKRAEPLLRGLEDGDRMKVYADWKNVLQLKPQPSHGRAVFKQHCSACHRLDQEGVAVGPDLFGIRNQSKEVILLHVIVPEYEIVPGFANYDVELKDGQIESGMISSETSSSIVLRKALGEERVLPRVSVAAITASGLSLMPQNLEANLTRQDMADLLAYLKGE